LRARRGAGAARTGDGGGARARIHAAIRAGADDVEQGGYADEVGAVVRGADAQGRRGSAEGERVFRAEGGRGVVPGAGVAAAEEGCEEGEDQDLQGGTQAHGRHRAQVSLGGAAGWALGLGGGVCIHLR